MGIFRRKKTDPADCLDETRVRERKREIKIGAFVGIALLIIAAFILIVGDISQLLQKKGYPLYVQFDSGAGLEKRTVVRIAGIKIGYTQDIRLKGTKAEVEMSIIPEVKLRKGSKATLAALGLLGEKYIEIIPGDESGYYEPGETIEGVSAPSFDQLGNTLVSVGEQIGEIGESIQGILGEPETQGHFRETIQNLSAFTADLKGFLEDNRQDLNRNMQKSSEVIAKIDERVDSVSRNLDELIKLMKDTVEENRGSLRDNLGGIQEMVDKIEESLEILNQSLKKINDGEGTIGKLIQEPELYEKAETAVENLEKAVRPLSSLRATVGLRTDYYGDSELLKSSLAVSLWPSPKQFVLGQVVHDPWEDRFKYSAQGGLRWGSIAPRAGIMESEFGAGLDYYAFGDRLIFSVEGFDLNRDPRPQFRVWTRFAATKTLSFLAGIDDFTLTDNREFFLGLRLGL